MSTTLELELAESGARFTPLGLELPEAMPEHEWAAIGRKLLRTGQVMQWWIGDWAAFGDANADKDGWRKKGALKEFCSGNGFRAETVSDYAWVSRSVHLSLRKEAIDYSVYKEIAPLKPKDQAKFLKAAEVEHLPVRELRALIRKFYGTEDGLAKDGIVLKMGTKLKGDLLKFFKDREESFWTEERIDLWKKEILELLNYVESKSTIA